MNKSVARPSFAFIDCGSVTSHTKGQSVGFHGEMTPPPYNRWF